jgi:hypothetical protein
MELRHRCVACRQLTYKWQRINGGQLHCYDGCYSTTGWDRRTVSGKPLWKMKEKEKIRETAWR